MSGIPVINGFNQVELAGLIWKPASGQTGVNMALGIVMRNIRFDQMLEKLLGLPSVPLGIFSEMTAGMLICLCQLKK